MRLQQTLMTENTI